jgi:hypothetical protein
MSQRSIRTRLARLERKNRAPQGDRVLARIWEALVGIIPLEQLDSETRRLIESLYADDRKSPDPIEARIAEAGRLPCRLKVPPPDPGTDPCLLR